MKHRFFAEKKTYCRYELYLVTQADITRLVGFISSGDSAVNRLMLTYLLVGSQQVVLRKQGEYYQSFCLSVSCLAV